MMKSKNVGETSLQLVFTEGIKTKTRKQWIEKQEKLEKIVQDDWLLNQPSLFMKEFGFTWLYPQKVKYVGDYITEEEYAGKINLPEPLSTKVWSCIPHSFFLIFLILKLLPSPLSANLRLSGT